MLPLLAPYCFGVRFMMFNGTFNNISAISWWSQLLVKETGENHRPATSHWQTLSHIVVLSTSHHDPDSNSHHSVVIRTDCTGSCKSNYHTITTRTVPSLLLWHERPHTDTHNQTICGIAHWHCLKYFRIKNIINSCQNTSINCCIYKHNSLEYFYMYYDILCKIIISSLLFKPYI